MAESVPPLMFNAHRAPVMARRGVVASSQAMASQAGLSILMAGGNAADAAVATAAALGVTEPASTGLGGDAFVLYYEARTKKVYALNGSGRAPAALTIERVRQEHLIDDQKQALSDLRHAHTVTVPGACAAWIDLLERFGSMPRQAVFAPAVRLAEEGFPVAPITAYLWQTSAQKELRTSRNGTELTIDGRGPRAGEIFKNSGLAKALRLVADGGKEAFYKGPIAAAIVKVLGETGSVMTREDLARHESTWDEPISTTYRGIRVWECPPNGQGLATLLALNVLEGFDLSKQDPDGTERWHLLIEAMRVAFADTSWYVADPKFFQAPLKGLLDKNYAAERRKLIDPKRATLDTKRGTPVAGSGTVYFCVVDGQGNACSFINSNYQAFGTGIVPAGWGFALQNRGHLFSSDEHHPNALAPGKRPYHTIIPGMMTRADGSLYAPFGVMGGFMQPQGHVLVTVAMLDDGLEPQAALDRPRFCIQPAVADGVVSLEDGIPPKVVDDLKAMGHPLVPDVLGYQRVLFGRGQIIRMEENGVLWAGSDGRADGCAMGF